MHGRFSRWDKSIDINIIMSDPSGKPVELSHRQTLLGIEGAMYLITPSSSSSSSPSSSISVILLIIILIQYTSQWLHTLHKPVPTVRGAADEQEWKFLDAESLAAGSDQAQTGTKHAAAATVARGVAVKREDF